jgi:hypothetical protein
MKLKFAWTALSFCLIGLGILCLYGVAILGVEPINQAWIFVALVYLGTVCLRPKIHVSLSFLEKSARLAGKAFGIVLIALSGLGLVEPLLRGPGSVLFAAASFPCFYLAKTCYVRAKKMGGMDALEALASDPRKPVLYLRPFREDELAAQRGKTFLRLRSEEEALAKVMNEIGPFICVGKPNESLSEVGAFRMYMSEEKWQEKVRDLMDRAQLVVLRVGWTDGFLWEVAQMTQSDSPQRVVLLITGTKEDYEAFRKMTQAYFPYPLPEYGVDMNRPLFGNGGLSSLRGFVHFDQDWIPHYVSLATVKQPWKYIPRTLGEGKLVKRLRWGLRPFLQKDGMAPKLPPIRWTATVILGIACRAVIMSLLRFYSLWIANG